MTNTSKSATHGTYDIFLETDNDKVGFNLVEDPETGAFGYQQGLAPAIAPRVDNTSFNYSSVPPEVKVTTAFEDWVGGVGYSYSASTQPQIYNWGLRVDGSTAGKLTPTSEGRYAYPLGNYIYGDNEMLPQGFGKIVHTSLGTYMLMNGVYKWQADQAYVHELGGGSQQLYGWEKIYNLADTNQALDLIEYGGYIWITLVDFYGATVTPARQGVMYLYSSDGIIFTQSTVANDEFLYFCVRGQTSGNPIIWGVDYQGNLRSNNAPASVWSGVLTVGTQDETVTGLLEHLDTIYVFKTNGIYKMNSAATGSEDVWLGAQERDNLRNGNNPILHTDGKIYVAYDGQLMQFDPVSNVIGAIFPTQSNEIYSGNINAIATDGQWLYLAFEPDWTFGPTHTSGSTIYRDNYMTIYLKGDPSVSGWHPIQYNTLGRTNGLGVSPAGTVRENPVLHGMMSLNKTSTTSRYYPSVGWNLADYTTTLPKLGEDWSSDTTMGASTEITDATSWVAGPWVDSGAANIDKYIASVQTIVDNASDGNYWALYWQFDDGIYDRVVGASGGGQVWIPPNSGANTDLYMYLEERFLKRVNTSVNHTGESLNRWRSIRYFMIYDDNGQQHPAVRSVMLENVVLPERVRTWNLQVIVSNDQELRGGGKMRESALRQKNFLFGTPNKQVKYYDRDGQNYVVKVQDIQSVSAFRGQSGDKEFFSVSLSEIYPDTKPDPLLSWGQGSWDTGQRYSTPN